MFKKLLKYDIKAISKLWWIGATISVVAAIVAAILIRFFIYVIDMNSDSIILNLASIFGLIAAIFCIIAVILAYVFTVVLVFVRFYKHFFTDEGYLTFTLPVKRSTLFFSKTLNAAIWLSAHLVLIIISLLLFALLVVPPEENGFFINFAFFEELGKLFAQAWEAIGAWLLVYIIEALLFIFISLVFSITLIYFCITVGSVLVKKAKLILSIGIYYAIYSSLTAIWQFSYYIFGSLMTTGMGILMKEATKNQTAAVYALLVLVVLSIISAIATIFYSLTQYLLDRKLNLA